MIPDPREPYGRIVNEARIAFAAEQEDDRGARWFIRPWEERAPGQRELDMRIASAVAVRAVADAKLDLTAGNREIVRLRAELDVLEKHRPAILGALRARLAVSPHGSDAKPYREALMALRGSEEEGAGHA